MPPMTTYSTSCRFSAAKIASGSKVVNRGGVPAGPILEGELLAQVGQALGGAPPKALDDLRAGVVVHRLLGVAPVRAVVVTHRTPKWARGNVHESVTGRSLGGMQRWEYKQTIIPGNVAVKTNLDELGLQGWELVSVFMRYLSGWETIFYFKRPLESGEPR